MKFKRLAEYLEKIEKTASRLEMTEILAQVFKGAQPEEIDQIVYLALGMMRPKYENIEFNLAETMMLRVISAAYNQSLDLVSNNFKTKGDLGEILPDKMIGEGKDLSVAEVYKRLMDVAVDEGQGSQDRKVNSMARLLKDLDLNSAKFVARIPVNKLRLGFSSMTVLDALSWMETGDKSLRPDLERAYNECTDIGKIARDFKQGGLKAVMGIKLQVGVPIRPALSERLPNADKIVEKLGVFVVEGKWDGLRVQIHFDKGKYVSTEEDLFGTNRRNFTQIFSRNLDNMTKSFPEIVKAAEQLPVRSVILDGEAVGYDPVTKKLLNFQETIQRKRKHEVKDMAKQVPLKVFVYDILYLNGKNVMMKNFRERRKLLEEVFKPPFAKASEGLVLVNQEIVSDKKRLNELKQKFINQGLEGVMCKKMDAVYQAGARNFNWVKLKKQTDNELADTIDCVVMGYYSGKGKRTGFGIGAFLVGVLNEEGKVGSIAKIGTGLTDEQWRELKTKSEKFITKNKPVEYLVDKNLECDFWVKPEMVVEIMADEITKSPIHAFGLALRFPRLVNFRDDKNLSEATTKKELEKLFKMQKK